MRYYRRMRTTAERRANGTRHNRELAPFVRAKRRANNLPNPWDDYSVCNQRSWKVKRKNQYRVGRRGEKHTYFVPINGRRYWYDRSAWQAEYNFKEYCEKHDIPFVVRTIKKTYKKLESIKKRVEGPLEAYYCFWHDKSINRHVWKVAGLRPSYKWVHDRWEWRTYSYDVGYELVWWSDKDIGIEYIL